MRPTAEAIRKHFIAKYGEQAFEAVANLFAEVGGDCATVDLSSEPAWREFALTLKFIPKTEIIRKAFLWCARHKMPLQKIDRETVPPSLAASQSPELTQYVFEQYPFCIANSLSGFRCRKCFDAAERYCRGCRDNSDSSQDEALRFNVQFKSLSSLIAF